jgi:peptide/nickel transport system permease protein
MIRFVARRLLVLVAVLFTVSIIVFFGARLFAPGDLATVIMGSQGGTRAQYAELRKSLGLDRPLIIQYLSWLGHAVHGDFGRSPITRRSVSSDLGSQIPVSLELTIGVLLVATIVGVPAGILAAVSKRRRLAAVVQSSLLVVFSVPVFVIGIVFLLVASEYLPDLYSASYTPISDGLLPNLRCMVLPALTMGIPTAAITMQLTRSVMLEVLRQPYIEFARAKGVSGRRITYIHALKNARPPILTLQGFQFGIVFGGLIVVEQVFSLPGIGRGILLSINERDYALLTAQVMVLAGAFVVVNAIVDFIQPLLDRRQVDV